MLIFLYFEIIIWTCFDILHLIFCDSHRVGDGQKAFFDTVVEYSTVLTVLGELFEWQTQ